MSTLAAACSHSQNIFQLIVVTSARYIYQTRSVECERDCQTILVAPLRARKRARCGCRLLVGSAARTRTVDSVFNYAISHSFY